MDAVLIAFAVAFVAELGDKSQIVALSLATRYPIRVVLGGIAVAYAFTQGIAATIGGALGAALPRTAIRVGAALLFFGLSIWTLLKRDHDDSQTTAVAAGPRRSAGEVFGVVLAMSLAELGDKTMLATTALAADRGALTTWIGATAGITASGALAVAVGRLLGARISQRATRILAAALFAGFGALLLLLDPLV